MVSEGYCFYENMSNLLMNYFLQINIWSYTGQKLLDSIETGHSANIFCTKFIPETSDELVVSGAGDAEVIFRTMVKQVFYGGFLLYCYQV